MNASLEAQVGISSICTIADLVPFSGVAVLVGGQQIALFYIPTQSISDHAAQAQVYAIGNYDPIGKANVLSRGIVGDKEGRLVVASPLYKQHFCLETGVCLEQPTVRVPVYSVTIDRDSVVLTQ